MSVADDGRMGQSVQEALLVESQQLTELAKGTAEVSVLVLSVRHLGCVFTWTPCCLLCCADTANLHLPRVTISP